MLAREVADAAPQSEAADARGANDPRRRGQTGLVRRGIDLRPRAAAAGANGTRGRIDLDGLHEGEVEDDSVVADPESAAVVAASANSEQEVMASREGDRLCHVRSAGAAGDQRGPAVDHCVVDRARLLVAWVFGSDQLTRELRPKLCSRCLCRIRGGAHVCLRFVGLRAESAPDCKVTVTGSTAAVMTWIDTVCSPTTP